jgi:hypothetical protein
MFALSNTTSSILSYSKPKTRSAEPARQNEVVSPSRCSLRRSLSMATHAMVHTCSSSNRHSILPIAGEVVSFSRPLPKTARRVDISHQSHNWRHQPVGHTLKRVHQLRSRNRAVSRNQVLCAKVQCHQHVGFSQRRRHASSCPSRSKRSAPVHGGRDESKHREYSWRPVDGVGYVHNGQQCPWCQ